MFGPQYYLAAGLNYFSVSDCLVCSRGSTGRQLFRQLRTQSATLLFYSFFPPQEWQEIEATVQGCFRILTPEHTDTLEECKMLPLPVLCKFSRVGINTADFCHPELRVRLLVGNDMLLLCTSNCLPADVYALYVHAWMQCCPIAVPWAVVLNRC